MALLSLQPLASCTCTSSSARAANTAGMHGKSPCALLRLLGPPRGCTLQGEPYTRRREEAEACIAAAVDERERADGGGLAPPTCTAHEARPCQGAASWCGMRVALNARFAPPRPKFMLPPPVGGDGKPGKPRRAGRSKGKGKGRGRAGRGGAQKPGGAEAAGAGAGAGGLAGSAPSRANLKGEGAEAGVLQFAARSWVAYAVVSLAPSIIT